MRKLVPLTVALATAFVIAGPAAAEDPNNDLQFARISVSAPAGMTGSNDL